MNTLWGTRIALWSESPEDLTGIRLPLLHLGCEILRAESLAQLGQWIESGLVDVVVTWLSPENKSALALITCLDGTPNAPPVLVVGRALDMGLYLDAMHRGAFDCIGLPVDENELARIIAAALETAGLHQVA
jgi:DNA-binding NtrC family response regulator